MSDTVCGCVVLIPSSSCSSCMRGTTHTHNDVLTTHHQLLILSAVSCSPILCSAALNSFHEGTLFCETLYCCCSHAESMANLQLSILPRCSRSIFSSEGYRRPSCSPSSFQLLSPCITANTSHRSFSAVMST